MPGPRDLLRRFRPVGAPGAAGARGVPADRVAELSAELAPVFAALADAEAEAARRRAAAEDYAVRRAAEATAAAAAVVAEGRVAADERRATAAADVARRAGACRVAAAAEAQAQAEEVAARAAERLPTLVARCGEQLRGELAVLAGGTSGAADPVDGQDPR